MLKIVLRIGHSILLFVGLIVLLFFFFNILGDPVTLLLDEDASPEAIDAIRQKFGYDRPLYSQFSDFLWDSLRGDFGRSIRARIYARDMILDRLPNTIILLQFAWILGAIGIPLGLLAAKGPKELVRRTGNSSSSAGDH